MVTCNCRGGSDCCMKQSQYVAYDQPLRRPYDWSIPPTFVNETGAVKKAVDKMVSDAALVLGKRPLHPEDV